MNDITKGFLQAIKTYLKLLPLIIIPVAGIILMTTIAPYYAISRGCKEFDPDEKPKRRKLALLFSLTLSTLLSAVLLIIASFLSSGLMLRMGEILVIGLIYGMFLIFSLLGAR